MFMTSLWKRAFQALAARPALALVAADEPSKPAASSPRSRPAEKRRKWPQALEESGPTIPNGSTCSRRSSRTSR